MNQEDYSKKYMALCGGKNSYLATYLKKYSKYICWLNMWKVIFFGW
jgi:hypothetical protein